MTLNGVISADALYFCGISWSFFCLAKGSDSHVTDTLAWQLEHQISKCGYIRDHKPR